MRFVCTISLSLLETRENTFGFLFSSRNWRKYLKFLHFFCKSSRSLLEPENRSRHFSFLFSKLEMWIPYFSFSSRFDFLASRQCLIPPYKNQPTLYHPSGETYNNFDKIRQITSHRRQVLESLLDLADPDFSPVICQFPTLAFGKSSITTIIINEVPILIKV